MRAFSNSSPLPFSFSPCLSVPTLTYSGKFVTMANVRSWPVYFLQLSSMLNFSGAFFLMVQGSRVLAKPHTKSGKSPSKVRIWILFPFFSLLFSFIRVHFGSFLRYHGFFWVFCLVFFPCLIFFFWVIKNQLFISFLFCSANVTHSIIWQH